MTDDSPAADLGDDGDDQIVMELGMTGMTPMTVTASARVVARRAPASSTGRP